MTEIRYYDFRSYSYGPTKYKKDMFKEDMDQIIDSYARVIGLTDYTYIVECTGESFLGPSDIDMRDCKSGDTMNFYRLKATLESKTEA